MTLIGLDVNTCHLYTGDKSLYIKFTLFGHTLWIQKWDTERAPNNRFRTPCFIRKYGTMGWTGGHRAF